MFVVHHYPFVAFALLHAICLATAETECAEALFGIRGGRPRHHYDIPMPIDTRDIVVGPLTNNCEFGLYHDGTSIRACDYDVPPTVEVLSLTTGRVRRNGNLTEAGVIYAVQFCTKLTEQ